MRICSTGNKNDTFPVTKKSNEWQFWKYSGRPATNCLKLSSVWVNSLYLQLRNFCIQMYGINMAPVNDSIISSSSRKDAIVFWVTGVSSQWGHVLVSKLICLLFLNIDEEYSYLMFSAEKLRCLCVISPDIVWLFLLFCFYFVFCFVCFVCFVFCFFVFCFFCFCLFVFDDINVPDQCMRAILGQTEACWRATTLTTDS